MLNPDDPLSSADKFINAVYTFNGIPTLIRFAGVFWQWTGNNYRNIEKDEIKSRLLRFLERAKVKVLSNDDGTPNYIPFRIKSSILNEIRDMMESRIYQTVNNIIPCWIGGESCEMPPSVIDPSRLIFGKSKILNLDDMETLPYSPHWFNFAALGFDYDPNAECPQWLNFLDSIFGDDNESKQTIMEWMGLCLTSITKFQKVLSLVGRKRSGKGTIARIQQKIVGNLNFVTPSTSDFGEKFGLQPFIGKTLAVVSDARFDKRNSSQVTEKILNITGEDAITINRKNKESITLRLPTKLMFLSNEIANIPDQSGALASRFIFLKLPNSFYGKEDLELEDKLSLELPGILRLAIQHLQVLLERGYFIQPARGKGLAQRMTALSSPVGEFAQQLTPLMTKDEIWEKWTDYCFAEVLGFGTKNALWNDLESAGYSCDFDAADILAVIRTHGGTARISNFRYHIGKFHRKGGTEALKRKLREMLKAGLVTSPNSAEDEGDQVEYFAIADALDESSANGD